MVRAKFYCNRVVVEKADQSYHTKEGNTEKLDVVSVTLNAVSATSAENKEFFASTPNGQIELKILRPEATGWFERGKEYYVEFPGSIAVVILSVWPHTAAWCSGSTEGIAPLRGGFDSRSAIIERGRSNPAPLFLSGFLRKAIDNVDEYPGPLNQNGGPLGLAD